MFLAGDEVVISATDLASAAACEFATVRALDVLLGRAEEVEEPADPLRDRAGRLGIAHERRLLAEYEARFPGGVVVAPAPDGRTRADLLAASAAALDALRSEARVFYRATVFDGGFVGYVDFLVRTDAG